MSVLRMPEVNRVILSGRLTADPDRRYAPDGTPVTRFTIAFHRRYRGRDGKFAEQTGYIMVVTYNRLADVCAEYLKKGNAVLVEGRLQMREWLTREAGKQQRLELRGESVHFLERAPGGPKAVGAEPAENTEEGLF